jgi:hypothetical protein
MKTHLKVIFGLGILILLLIHWLIFRSKEGFFDSNSDYEKLRLRLKNDLGDYCKTADYVRNQITKMQLATGGSSQDIEKLYMDVYTCKDFLAGSRQSCLDEIFSHENIMKNANENMLKNAGLDQLQIKKDVMKYEPCSTFMDLPEWSNSSIPGTALAKIKNDLPQRLKKETDWFDSVIKKLQDGIDSGANPPADMPTSSEINKQSEGFQSICSPEAALIKEAQTCIMPVMPNVSDEIIRINKLLDNPVVRAAVNKSKQQLATMQKIESDLEKAKNGTLYEWQKDPAVKPFPKFQGGDRIKGLIFSMQQNQ